MKVGIFCENSSLEIAKELQTFLKSQNLNSEIKSRELFPIADPMVFFLSGISNNFNLAFMLIANHSNGYFWISKELKRQHLMGNCNNIYPVFYTIADIPDWWNQKENIAIAMDDLEAGIATLDL